MSCIKFCAVILCISHLLLCIAFFGGWNNRDGQCAQPVKDILKSAFMKRTSEESDEDDEDPSLSNSDFPDKCPTPSKETGHCIPIEECTYILNFVSNPLSAAGAEFLRSYQCGFESSFPKVCCPRNPGMFQSNVFKHKSIKLLPSDVCGQLPDTDKILKGNKTSLFEFPWMALLIYNTKTGLDFRCGGTLINDRYVLTAAHCIKNAGDSELLKVRLGEYDISTRIECKEREGLGTVCASVQDIGIEEIIAHPQYDTSIYSNDIALIRLSRPANISVDNIKPVCLPLDKMSRNYNFTNKHAVVTGWGVTEYGRGSDVLMKIEIPVISNDECRKAHLKAIVTHKQICAGGEKDIDTCHGDSGGPLHVVGALGYNAKYIQQGIVSFGSYPCGEEGIPGVYTRVAYYMDWLLDNLKP